MRVLMVSQFFAPVVGGQERAVEDMSRALARRGHSVSVATLAVDGTAGSRLEGDLRVHRFRGTFQRMTPLFRERDRPHVPPILDRAAVAALRRIVQQESPDVIHAHDWLVASVVPVARRSRTPVVLSLHDHSLTCANKRLMQGHTPCSGPALAKCVACASAQYGHVKGPAIVLGVRRLPARVSVGVERFLPVSEAVASLNGLASGDRAYEVLPNFIPDELLGLHPGTSGRGGGPAGLPARYAIFLGDATADKGAGVLLAAHSEVGGRPHLLFVGRALLAQLGSPPESVTIWGPQPHQLAMEALEHSLFAVVPSLCPEAFGLSALEAMALGRPVIAARSGGLEDLVVDGETGILTPPGNVGALAEAIVRLRDRADLRHRMGLLARKRAEGFGESVVVQRLERLYHEVISARARRGD